MSRFVSDTPRSLQPSILQRDIETEVAHCVGGVLSPLLANVALSVLDEHIAGMSGGPATGAVERAKRLRHGQPNFRLVRYADDWCLMVRGTRAHAEAQPEGIAAVLATVGLDIPGA
jgi:RNA-directed DNA polymerase